MRYTVILLQNYPYSQVAMLDIQEFITTESRLIHESEVLDTRMRNREISFNAYEEAQTELIAQHSEMIVAFRAALAQEHADGQTQNESDSIFYNSCVLGQTPNGYQDPHKIGGYEAVQDQ